MELILKAIKSLFNKQETEAAELRKYTEEEIEKLTPYIVELKSDDNGETFYTEETQDNLEKQAQKGKTIYAYYIGYSGMDWVTDRYFFSYFDAGNNVVFIGGYGTRTMHFNGNESGGYDIIGG